MEAPYNAAFFRLYESVFFLYQGKYGQRAALGFMRSLFADGLGPAYDAMGFQCGLSEDFARVVGQRDAGVGLRVVFPELTREHIVYQFHTDPFPNLRGSVAPEELDATYLEFKIAHLLGQGWGYRTTRHLWHGDAYTEHVITKIF